MRPFSEFDAALPADLVRRAATGRLRSLATWAYLGGEADAPGAMSRCEAGMGRLCAAAAGSFIDRNSGMAVRERTWRPPAEAGGVTRAG